MRLMGSARADCTYTTEQYRNEYDSPNPVAGCPASQHNGVKQLPVTNRRQLTTL